MNREVHVRFCEHLKGKFLRVTRPPVAQLEPGPCIVIFDYQAGRSWSACTKLPAKTGKAIYWSTATVDTTQRMISLPLWSSELQ
ncbi:MAG: hypothetical protein Q8K59_09535 [Nitrosomonas sp.]|nr:hypothetical protein [Nitrosomonas sp.]MDP1951316.1 hypothetical protein [Nitrosomonas sp.]